MTTTLQDAIAAARAGESERAQLITADVIRDKPDDPNAWYLLSQLVDSDSRRAVYLAKTLALDPNHPRARREYDELPLPLHDKITGGEPVVSYAAEVMEVHTAKLVETYPAAEVEVEAGDWPEAVVAEPDEVPEPVAPEVIAVETPLVNPEVEAPGWLQPLGPAAVPATTVAAAPAGAEVAYQPPPPVAQAVPYVTARQVVTRRNTANQALTLLLGILLFLALLVVGMLVYLLLP